ncbi:hypothetical protein D4R87_02720 [bacterium]|nr:MAG: hypothetical protein D4R87_02720 [bacterium]
MIEILKLIRFAWPLFKIPFLVSIILCSISVIIGCIYAFNGSRDHAWNWYRKGGWWMFNNNGWWCALFIAMILTAGIAIQKTWFRKSSTIVWEGRKALSNPKSTRKKIFNYIVEDLKGHQILDPNNDGNLVRGDKSYPPIKIDPPKGQRPNAIVWWCITLLYFILLFLLAIPFFADDIARARKKHAEKIKEEQSKEAVERKHPATMGLFLVASIIGEIFSKFIPSIKT